MKKNGKMVTELKKSNEVEQAKAWLKTVKAGMVENPNGNECTPVTVVVEMIKLAVDVDSETTIDFYVNRLGKLEEVSLYREFTEKGNFFFDCKGFYLFYEVLEAVLGLKLEWQYNTFEQHNGKQILSMRKD